MPPKSKQSLKSILNDYKHSINFLNNIISKALFNTPLHINCFIQHVTKVAESLNYFKNATESNSLNLEPLWKLKVLPDSNRALLKEVNTRRNLLVHEFAYEGLLGDNSKLIAAIEFFKANIGQLLTIPNLVMQAAAPLHSSSASTSSAFQSSKEPITFSDSLNIDVERKNNPPPKGDSSGYIINDYMNFAILQINQIEEMLKQVNTQIDSNESINNLFALEDNIKNPYLFDAALNSIETLLNIFCKLNNSFNEAGLYNEEGSNELYELEAKMALGPRNFLLEAQSLRWEHHKTTASIDKNKIMEFLTYTHQLRENYFKPAIALLNPEQLEQPPDAKSSSSSDQSVTSSASSSSSQKRPLVEDSSSTQIELGSEPTSKDVGAPRDVVLTEPGDEYSHKRQKSLTAEIDRAKLESGELTITDQSSNLRRSSR